MRLDGKRWEQAKQVFLAAREETVEDRAAYLEAACEGDVELRHEVESLLAADRETGDDFLEELAAPEALALIGSRGAASWIGRKVGAYRIASELGRGGMGAVFLALRADAEFDKQVAIKVISHGLDSGEAIARFRRERQILAGLDHPNIARLLDGGATDEGLPFLVMEYIDGSAIDRYCGDHQLSVRDRLALFLKVCAAVQFAHRSLVVHRDLKPSNILVTVDGEPKLLDFGIAKLLHPGEGVTQAGLRLMTPEYASPEQVMGDAITTATDVYSLGVLLCELLCGRRPYTVNSASPAEIQRVVCTEEPMRPSTAVGLSRRAMARREATALDRLRRQLAGDLDNIVLMALRKEPQRRYSSVEQLAQDVTRYLAGLPVLARGDRWTYRTGKWVARHRWGVALATVSAALLVAGLAAVLWQAGLARKQRDLAVRAASSMIYELAEGLSHMSGPTGDRIGLLARAAGILDEVGKDAAEPEFARLQADSNRVLSQTYRVLGDLPHAAERAQRAETLARQLVAARAFATAADRAVLAAVLVEAGDVRLAMGDSRGADARYDEAIALLGATDGRASGGATRTLVLALMRKGDRRFGQGQTDAAANLYQRSLRVEKEMPGRDGHDSKLRAIHLTFSSA
jgi:serine/threonine protein kinase